MKEILMFMMETCPHCKLARGFHEELFARHPEWRALPLTMVDERLQPALAAEYDYYYVPTYYVDGVKVHEGHAEKEDVERVFRAAADTGEDEA